MSTTLTLKCNLGETGIPALQRDLVLDSAGKLECPPTWVWTPDDANRVSGTVSFPGRTDPLRFHLEVTDPVKPTIQCSLIAPDSDERPPAPKLCFSLTGTGGHLVGTWIAEGGG